MEYRRQAPGGQIVVNTGAINLEGNITCNCVQCKGCNAIPNSTFEEHSGSKVRRPAQFTYLTDYNLSLKVGGSHGGRGCGLPVWALQGGSQAQPAWRVQSVCLTVGGAAPPGLQCVP